MRLLQNNSAFPVLVVFILIILAACGGGGDACIDEPTLDTDLKTSDVAVTEKPVEEVEQVEDERSVDQDADQEESAVEESEEDNPSPSPIQTPIPSPTSIPEPTPEEIPTPTEIPEIDIESILLDTYTWGQSQKTRTLQQVLGLSVDGYYGSGTRSAHIAELEERGLSTGSVPEIPPTPTAGPTPTPVPTPTPAPPAFSPAVVTQATNSCSDIEFTWSNPDSDPDSWQIKLDVRANVGSGNPPASLWVSKTHTVSGSNRSETFTSLEFHGQNHWVTLWGNGAPYSLVISRVDNGIVGSSSNASNGLMWDDC